MTGYKVIICWESNRVAEGVLKEYKSMHFNMYILTSAHDQYIIMEVINERHIRKKLFDERLQKEVSKFSFQDRVINQWGVLPDEVVCSKNIHRFRKGK